MKKLMLAAAFAAATIATTGAAETESWTMKKPALWSREKGAATVARRADGAFELRHAGAQDWVLAGFPQIDVKPGDEFRFSCASETLAGATNAASFALSVRLCNAAGEVLYWTYGQRAAKSGERVESSFMVPTGVSKIVPCASGRGAAAFALIDMKIERVGSRAPKTAVASMAAETDALRVELDGANGGMSVTDKRTGRRWAPNVKWSNGRIVTEMTRAGRAICATLVDPFARSELRVLVSPVPSKPEVLVTVVGEGAMPGVVKYPAAFVTKKGDRLIVPMNEGISYPVDETDGVPWRLAAYSGHGVCMAFWGVQDDATGAGYMGIIETPDDASVAFEPQKGVPVSPVVCWEAQKGRFGYPRRVRYVFLDKGGYVAMCKRYRAYAKEQGKLKTFAEKVGERPLVDRLLGAPNIWCWESDKIGMAQKLKAAGIDRFLWSSGGTPEQVAALAKMDGVLVGRYDVYRDIYRPEQLKALGWKTGSNMDAWPEGAAWDSVNSNDWRKAWGVKTKDGKWTHCACMCDAVSAKFCRKHVIADLQTKPYNTRFIDVTTAAGWDTCENPAHPMTRTDSRLYRMDLLRLLGDDYGLVVGSETGHDAAVPYCDYFEGMLSLGNYRVPDSGRYLQQIWTNVPPNVAKFQVGAAYRLPLWELVYHDCLCAHWYWGDYNNKLPSLWDKRDLFNVLYGTMGMYMFNAKQWEDLKDRFVQSYKLTSPVARKTGYSEMIDHRILSPDRLVQRSVFADGTVVTVNFGDKPFTLPEGDVLPGGGHLAGEIMK